MKLLNKNIILLLFSLLLFSCTKKEDFFPDFPTSDIPGMGDAGGQLQGTPFHLPTGIEILDTLKGFDDNTTPCQMVGYGWFVNVEVKIINHGPDTILVLPAGLTFKSLSEEDQNGILVKKQILHFGIGDTCTAVMNAFCVNAGRHASSSDSRFEFGPITNAEPMLELIDLLKNKKINNDASIVQDVVWDISDYGGMTDEDKAAIIALPNM